jgi:GLPGLI family protein
MIMKNLNIASCLWVPALLLTTCVSAQKKIPEFTVVYNSTITSTAAANPSPYSSVNSYYVKGSMSRSEINSALASFSTIYDSKTGTAVVLREVSGQKLLIRMNAEDWQDKNRRYQGIKFNYEPESKIIAGYKCMKATATTKDSLRIEVYYTKDIVADNKDFNPEFRNLDGFPLEYNFSKGNLTIRFVLASINLNPVAASKFDIPTGGYREMTYAESKKLGGNL